MPKGFLLLQLALPPTVNQSYFCSETGGGIRMVMTQRAKAYKEMAEEMALMEWKRLSVEIDQDTRFAIRIVMVLEKNTRDVDANIKLVMDAVMAGIKDATDLEGLSDLRVFHARMDKRLVNDFKVRVLPGLWVQLIAYQKGGLFTWPKTLGKTW